MPVASPLEGARDTYAWSASRLYVYTLRRQPQTSQVRDTKLASQKCNCSYNQHCGSADQIQEAQYACHLVERKVPHTRYMKKDFQPGDEDGWWALASMKIQAARVLKER